MDYSRSPEDNTSVIKMVNGLKSFLRQPQVHTSKPRMDFSLDHSTNSLSTSGSFSMFQFDSLHNTQRKRSMDTSDYATLSRDEKAEIITAKSKVARLENEVKSLESEKKRSEIEEETKRKLNSSKILKEREECETLRTRFKEVVNKKQTVKDELADLQKKYDVLKTLHHDETKKWQLERLQLNSQLDETRNSSSGKLSELKEKYTRQSTELLIYTNKLEEAEAQLKLFRSRQAETNDLVSDYNNLKHHCELAEHKVKVLEENASRVDESSMLMQRNQAELAKYRGLERENYRLVEDNNLYRDSAENALILQEKVDNFSAKLLRSEAIIENLRKLEYENEELKLKMKKWESSDILGGESKPRSPGELTRIISELQRSQLSIIEKQGELEASVSIKDSSILNKTDECSHLHELCMDLQNKNEQLEDRCQKLQRRLTLVSTDRDGLRRVLSSYEKEDGSDSKTSLQEAEDRIAQYNKQITDLENELRLSRKEASMQKTLYLQLQLDHEKLKASSFNSSVNIKETIQTQESQKHLEDLQSRYNKLAEEKEILEIRLERRQLQGDYNPFKTKVLHLPFNPTQIAREKYLRDMENVRVENEKLRKKVFQLQQARRNEEDESMNVSKLIKSSKPMEEAMNQIQQEKLKSQRLKEQFSKTAKDFREAIYNILGFSFKATKDDTYRVQSIYSERPDDFFLFICSRNKDGVTEAGMIETAYTREWSQAIKDYLQDGDSIPAFLSAITLELFSRTTQTRDLAVARKAKQL